VSLALFHTIFNLLGVALMWPVTARLAAYLNSRFVTESERLAQPEYLDQNVRATPVLAMQALNLELIRLGSLVRDHTAASISREGSAEPAMLRTQQGLRALIDAVEVFVSELEMERLPDTQKGNLPIVLRTTGYLEDVLSLLEDLEDHRRDIQAIMLPAVLSQVTDFQAAVLTCIRASNAMAETFEISELESEYAGLRQQWHDLKDILLNAAAARAIPIVQLNSALEGLRSTLKIAEQLTKAAERLYTLGLSVPGSQTASADSEDIPGSTGAAPTDSMLVDERT